VSTPQIATRVAGVSPLDREPICWEFHHSISTFQQHSEWGPRRRFSAAGQVHANCVRLFSSCWRRAAAKYSEFGLRRISYSKLDGRDGDETSGDDVRQHALLVLSSSRCRVRGESVRERRLRSISRCQLRTALAAWHSLTVLPPSRACRHIHDCLFAVLSFLSSPHSCLPCVQAWPPQLLLCYTSPGVASSICGAAAAV